MIGLSLILSSPHIVLTDGRQERQPNHRGNVYLFDLRKKISDNTRVRIFFFFFVGRSCLPSVNTICGGIMIGLSLLSSVSKHNKWSYYNWVVVVVVTTYCVY
jgi:hypothetical protein